MRTFISIDMPEEVQQEIKKIQEQLPEFYGKKTEIENLHLTLKFLGEVDKNKIEEAKRRLQEIRYEKFETELKYLGFFDNVKRGKRYGPIWLHLNNCEGLQKKVDEQLRNLFEPEKRFMSHLTIARVKGLKNKEYFLEELKKIEIGKIKFVVDKFKLKESVSRPEGSSYKTVKNYVLT